MLTQLSFRILTRRCWHTLYLYQIERFLHFPCNQNIMQWIHSETYLFWAHKNFSIVLGFHDVSMLCLPQVFVTQPCNQLYNRCSRQKQPLEKAPFLAHATSLEGKRKAANFLSKAKAKTPRRESSRMKMSCFQTFRELCFFLPYLHIQK